MIAGAALAVAALTLSTDAAAQPSASVDGLRALLVGGAQSDRARLRAADLLGDLDDPRAETILIDSLSDSKEIVRFGAARALGRPGRSGAIEPLVKLLGASAESTSVRAAAAFSLGGIGDARAVPVLVVARGDRAPDVRVAARQALLALPKDVPLSRFELLSEILTDREAAEAPRADAARMLGESADPRAMPLLVAALQEPATSQRPVISFGDLLEARVAAKASLPAAAARALGRFPANEAVPALVQAAPASVGEGKVAILETLAGLRARSALGVFVAALGDREPRARRWAAFVLAELAERDMLDPLRSAVGDSDEGVRLYAARALLRLHDVGAVDALAEALQKEQVPPVRDALAEALAVLAPVSPM
jgi:HEAT repeat protein